MTALSQDVSPLNDLLPEIGSTWEWIDYTDRRTPVVVTATQEFGGSWFVQAEAPNGLRCWNTLNAWVETTVKATR